MKLITLNKSNEIIEVIENNDNYIIKVLLKQLWNKQMKITFTNGFKYIFEDVPTQHGCIDL